VKQNFERVHVSKFSKDRLTPALTSSLSLVPAKSSLTSSQVSSLMPTLANKLATATHKISMQCFLIKASDSQARSLIRVLSLQAIT